VGHTQLKILPLAVLTGLNWKSWTRISSPAYYKKIRDKKVLEDFAQASDLFSRLKISLKTFL
jgi:hypothetical protein